MASMWPSQESLSGGGGMSKAKLNFSIDVLLIPIITAATAARRLTSWLIPFLELFCDVGMRVYLDNVRL